MAKRNLFYRQQLDEATHYINDNMGSGIQTFYETNENIYDLTHPPYISAYNDSEIFNVTTSYTPLVINQVQSSENITLANNEFTVTKKGVYEGILTITANVSGRDTEIIVAIEVSTDGGTNWVDYPQIGFYKFRDDGTYSGKVNGMFVLNAYDKIRMKIKTNNACTLEKLTDGTQYQNCINLSVKRVHP